MIKIKTPLKDSEILNLKAGDMVSMTGYIYTARDAAHKRISELLTQGKEIPFDIKNQVIYYTGPCPAGAGRVTGSAGPTTSSRMDAYTPKLLDAGLKGMIGKGDRNEEVISSIIKNKAVYFAVTGGAGALIAKCIKECSDIAFFELGTEALKKIFVEDMPCVVAIDCFGNDLYKTEVKKFERSKKNG